jgi:hypothetical protein
MARHTKLVGLALALIACSGGNDRQTTRGLGTGRDADAASVEADTPRADADDEVGPTDPDAGTDQPDADAGSALGDATAAIIDANASAIDATTITVDAATGGLDASDAAIDSAAPLEAAPADADDDADDEPEVPPPDPSKPFWLRVVVDNPHGHPNEVRVDWGGNTGGTDDNGYYYAQTLPDSLDLYLGGGDEEQKIPLRGIESGMTLHFVYRHFREPESIRPIRLPDVSPPGTTQRTVASSARSDYVKVDETNMSRVYFHTVGASPYIATATGLEGFLGFAVTDDLEPPTEFPFPAVTLGPWLPPRAISVPLLNGSTEAGAELFFHRGLHAFRAEGSSSGPYLFNIPPGFADFVEARVTDLTGETVEQIDRRVARVVARCGGEANSVPVDLADALAPPTAVGTPEGNMVRWTFPTLALDQLGDLMVFDGVVMPATQSSVLLPNTNNNSHVLLRVDVGSAAGYADLFRKQLLSLDDFARDNLRSAPWCHGTDVARVTRTEWDEP